MRPPADPLSSFVRLIRDAAALHAVLPRLFLALAVPMVLFFVFAVPPLQTPDEPAHLYRADHIAQGAILGVRQDARASGGPVDPAFPRLVSVFDPQINDRTRTMTFDDLRAAAAIPLTGGVVFVSFINTVQYGPLLYLPQALALAVAHGAGLDALPAFWLARLFNGAAALAVGFLALRLAGRGRFVLFFLLTTPMTLSLFGSVGQDALMIAGSALVFGLVSRIIGRSGEGRGASVPEALALLALIVALAWGRLPNLTLGVVFLLIPLALPWGRSRCGWPGWALLGVAVLLSALWGMAMGAVRVELLPDASATEQARALLADPASAVAVAVRTLASYGLIYAAQVIGVLGWLEVVFPRPFYAVALLAFPVALLADGTRPWPLGAGGRTLLGAGLLAGIGGVFLGLYLTWTPVGAPRVDGVQGRYLIPFLAGAGLVVPDPGAGAGSWVRFCLPLLVLVPLAGALLSIVFVLRHFY